MHLALALPALAPPPSRPLNPDEEEPLTASEALLDVMGQPYSKHYFTSHKAIPKDSN
jgi:hypothetical protein